MRIFILSSIIVIISAIFSSCNSPHKDTSIQDTKRDSIEVFENFYNRFHEDSLFQISRILFPLPGHNIDSDYNPDEKIEIFKWDKNNWDMQKKILDQNFKNELRKYNDSIIERIYIENSGFEIVRKFYLHNKKWYLGFYGSQNL
ncbi:hypothetical protein [Fluviicola sp.]|jgi:hypothetical protein|uniref:hypothetical protein n=1 Tax=Fluviicola sp. TaxID=1917219 RepID=UPI00282874A9|nr:hypothetical protein [Fluviicola sp.]MDR0801721.1 hypothetical protein [Fluviicola sp.]